jgi:uracil-DNA glycosylase
METINESWKPLFEQFNFNLDGVYTVSDIVYPDRNHIFRVFEMDVKKCRVVLLGQDPYHGQGQAHGLSFSVPDGTLIPPSLRNIYKELQSEFPDREYKFLSGNLEKWFYRENILLLNSSLSVIKGKPGSHMEIWEEFTDKVIEFISEHNKTCVFLLLGNFAKQKKSFILDKERIVEGVHPSPMAATRGFFGSNVFIKVENLLGEKINWQN